METIDLRSDTVTQPSRAMRKAMAEAPVGDDVYGEDPTIKELEELGASMAGKEAALFMTSGTQGNLGALLSLCSHGDGVILGEGSHIYNYERGGLAALGGFVPLVVAEAGGIPLKEAVFRWNRPENVHFAPAKVVCLENTHNRGGGLAVDPETLGALASKIHAQGLLIHLDGARLWNAAVKYGVSIEAYTAEVDTVQLCLSKGLGAPGGSLLCGTQDMVGKARNWRKMLGGGMRQAGILGAGGLYALKNNLSLLEEDHHHAALLASLLREGGFEALYGESSTNMVFLETRNAGCPVSELVERCAAKGVLGGTMGSALRYVTHLGVTESHIYQAAEVILKELKSVV